MIKVRTSSLTPSQPQNMRINILQEGSKIVRTLEVFGVQMLQYGML